jgi:adenylylsulfate kinase
MLKERMPYAYRIDGDQMRELFTNKDYSIKGRVTNIDTAQKISHYLNNQGKDVIVSLVSPYIDQREEFKELMGDNLVEIYCHTNEPRERDHFRAIAYIGPKENYIDLDTTTPAEETFEVLLDHLSGLREWNKHIHVGSSMDSKPNQYAMFVGRWQPLHDGHKALFKQAMDEGKNVLICIRVTETSEKNPYTPSEVKANIEEYYANEVANGKIVVRVIPDICSIEFGRGVGYDIIERIPPKVIKDISATKLRAEMNK